MVRLPGTGKPIAELLAELWEINCHMKVLLQSRLRL
jgi:hypothetical protein